MHVGVPTHVAALLPAVHVQSLDTLVISYPVLQVGVQVVPTALLSLQLLPETAALTAVVKLLQTCVLQLGCPTAFSAKHFPDVAGMLPVPQTTLHAPGKSAEAPVVTVPVQVPAVAPAGIWNTFDASQFFGVQTPPLSKPFVHVTPVPTVNPESQVCRHAAAPLLTVAEHAPRPPLAMPESVQSLEWQPHTSDERRPTTSCSNEGSAEATARRAARRRKRGALVIGCVL